MIEFTEHHLLGQKLILSPDRALFWKEKKTLIIADPHFGKAQVFRERGIPLPRGTTADDLKRLSGLISCFNPLKLLILGDLTHDRTVATALFRRLIEQWRSRHSAVQLVLVSGNHDRRSGRPPAQFRLDQVIDALFIFPFHFSHKPTCETSRYGIAGHLHPAVTVAGKGRLKETLPCFYFGPRHALIPAFGGFTGNQILRPTLDDKIYVVAGHEVLAMRQR